MKLAILCTMVKRFGRKGYYNSQEIGLGRALADKGHDVIIYKGTDDKSQVEDIVLGTRLLIKYLYMPHIGAHGFMSASRMDRDFDGMLCFSDQQVLLRHIWRFCRKNNIVFVPYIGTTYSLHVGTLRGNIMNRVFAATTLPIYKQIPILAKTEAARSELVDLGVPKTLIRLAPVGIDVTELHQDFEQADRAALRQELGFSPEDVVLCNVARFDPDKRTLNLLDVFMRVRDKKKFRLLIVGKGVMREAIDGKIHQCGIEEEVTILDQVPYADMWKIYTAADYYLNLSRTEIFGMSVMEAVYYRTSVAAIKAIGPSLILKDMPGHCLCEDDKGIEEWILKDYPDKASLEESADRLVKGFSWDRCAEAFLRLVLEERA